MSNILIPVTISLILIYGIWKRIPLYDTFTQGAKKAFNLVLNIFPYIASIMLMITLATESGLMESFSQILSPILSLFGIPKELCELVIIRPFSGSGSLVVLNDIFQKYGADSYISRCASVILSSSETIFYVATIYFSQTSVKKLFYAIPLGLICCYLGVIISCFVCKFI